MNSLSNILCEICTDFCMLANVKTFLLPITLEKFCGWNNQKVIAKGYLHTTQRIMHKFSCFLGYHP